MVCKLFSVSSKPSRVAQPGLSRSNGSHPQQEGTNLGVPIWLVLPRREATDRLCLICAISTYLNGAVQLRVGLELVDIHSGTESGILKGN